jgi:hypothetical protein
MLVNVERDGLVSERTLVVCDLHDGLVESVAHVVVNLDGEVVDADVCGEHLAALREGLRGLGLQLGESGGDRPRRKARGGNGRVGAKAGSSASGGGRRPHRGSGRHPAVAASNGGGASLSQREQVRQWARENSIEVADRGRLSTDVVRRYQEAHEGQPLSA